VGDCPFGGSQEPCPTEEDSCSDEEQEAHAASDGLFGTPPQAQAAAACPAKRSSRRFRRKRHARTHKDALRQEARRLCPVDDDDSANDDLIGRGLAEFRGKELAGTVTFTVNGVQLDIEELRACSRIRVPLSTALAQKMAGGIEPTAFVALQHGRLVPLGPAARYRLQRSLGCARTADRAQWFLTAVCLGGYSVFYNFVLKAWQPMAWALSGAYAPSTEVLYVAFVPVPRRGPARGGPAMFAKLGYRELSGSSGEDALIGYVEKKSAHLKLTNVRGAGIFVIPVPANHKAFGRPGRAAEASLKAVLLHSADVMVTPSDHCAEFAAFSSSLEYLFIEARPETACNGILGATAADPLPALARALRGFSGDAGLQPQHAVASCGLDSTRVGRKHLYAWSGPLRSCLVSATAEPEAATQGTTTGPTGAATPLPRSGHFLWTRAKRPRPADHVADCLRLVRRAAARLRHSAPAIILTRSGSSSAR